MDHKNTLRAIYKPFVFVVSVEDWYSESCIAHIKAI